MSCLRPLARGRRPHATARADWRAVLAGERPYDFYGPGLPPVPTSALPGTADKVAVLCARYERREQLFCAQDAQTSEAAALAHDTFRDLVIPLKETA